MKKMIKYIVEYFMYFMLTLKLHKLDDKIFILCTPLHGNLGDQAILEAEKNFLNIYYPKYKVIEIPVQFINHEYIYKRLKRKIGGGKHLFITRRRIYRRCMA